MGCDGVIPLREHLEGRIDGLAVLLEQRIRSAERAVEIAMAAANTAIGKQEAATETRFRSVNEFRNALNDMLARMMPRSESDQRFSITSEKLDAIDTRLTRIEGAGLGVKGTWGVFLAVIAALAAAIGGTLALMR